MSSETQKALGADLFPRLFAFQRVAASEILVSGKPGALALSRPFYLDLKPVTQLYEHWTVGDNTNTDWTQIPPLPTRTADSAVFTDPKTTGGLDYVLFVHGWRMAPWERRAFASTGFKRLWHLGYQGRYGLFSWPTDYTGTAPWDMLNPVTGPANRQNYDRSEQRAWNSADGLEYLLRELNKEQTYRVRLLAHSMGNIVASKALRLYAGEANLPLIHTYIASQAASVAHAYDAVNPEVRAQIFFPFYFRVPEMYAAFPRGTNNIARPYFIGMTNALSKTGTGAARLFNFHNVQDYALNSTVSWPINQSLKPDDGWSALFHGTNTDYTFFDHNTQLYLDANKLDQVFDIASSRILVARFGGAWHRRQTSQPVLTGAKPLWQWSQTHNSAPRCTFPAGTRIHPGRLTPLVAGSMIFPSKSCLFRLLPTKVPEYP